MEAGPPGAQWSGFKDFSQFRSPTRIVAGRGLLDGSGFEFTKEGAGRVILVTDEVGLPTRLSEVGVSEESIGQLAEDAMGEGSTLVNPREATKEEFAELFRQAL